MVTPKPPPFWQPWVQDPVRGPAARRRQRMNVLAILGLTILIGGSVLLMLALKSTVPSQDCRMAGFENCATHGTALKGWKPNGSLKE